MKKLNQNSSLLLKKTKIAKLNDQEARLIIGGNDANNANVDTSIGCILRSSILCFISYTTGD